MKDGIYKGEEFYRKVKGGIVYWGCESIDGARNSCLPLGDGTYRLNDMRINWTYVAPLTEKEFNYECCWMYHIGVEVEPELKPCPFCQVDAARMGTRYVMCDCCGARTRNCTSRNEAITAWNKRI
jgi:hypothetical protein